MKKILLLGLALSFAFSIHAQDDPVLMEINGKPVKRSEFEYIYNKNNSNNAVEKKSLDEYVDLFVNFKLKVAEAEAQGLDTTKNFINEFRGYRSQLAKSYLTDPEVDEAYIRSIYEHMKEDIEASHILIDCPMDASPADTLAAYNKAMEVYNLLKKGTDFAETAKKYSDDPSVKQNDGQLGYFSALQMVPAFEDAAYALKPGEISLPVRSRFGYHIIKVTNRRPDPGKVKVAHIFKHVPQSAPASTMDKAMAQMDSVYNAICGGADFGELAEKYSDDVSSAKRGGELNWISMRQTIPEFEEQAFSLKVGEVSKPFKSSIGVHIVKVLDRKALEPYEEKRKEIAMILNRAGANDKGQKALIARLKNEYGMSDMNWDAYNMLLNLAPDAMLGDSTYMAALGNRNDVLFTFAGKPYGVQDFMKFANGYNRLSKKSRSLSLHTIMDVYMDKVVLDYEDSRLEEKYPDFALLANEYRDGILLFDISNKEVWEKASNDEKGLEEFFKKNKKNYFWKAPHFKGIVVHCVSDSLEKPVIKLLKKNDYNDWNRVVLEAFNNDSVKLVNLTKGLFVKGENKYVDYFKFKGEKFEPYKNYPYTFVYGKMLKKKPEDFRDVRGPVSADYQTYLEDKWVKDLRKKYADKIIIHEDVLKTVNNH